MIRGSFLDVFNQSIAASYLIIAVMIARVLLKKAPKSVYCVLWLLVGIRLIMPFSFVSTFCLIPSGAQVRGNITQFMGNDTTEEGYQAVLDMASPNNAEYINEEMIRAIGNQNDSAESVNRPFVYFTIAAAVWIIGIGIMLVHLMISWFRIARRVRFAIPDEWEGIKYYRCDEIDSPFLFGIFKTRIYVPSGLCGENLSYVLKHETVHRQRRDYLIKPIGYLLLTIYWFNPFVWAAYILLCRDVELACDERVIRELGGEYKKEYAHTLLSCSVNHRTIAACPVAFGETSVKGRVKNVLNYKKPTFWVMVAAVVVCVIIVVCFMTVKVGTDTAQNGSGAQFVMVNPASSQGYKMGSAVSGQQTGNVLNEESDIVVYLQEELSKEEVQPGRSAVLDITKEELLRIEELEEELKVIQEEYALANDAQRELLSQQLASLEAEKKAILAQMNVSEANGIEIDYTAYVKQWAEAFCGRDGKPIIEMADEMVRDEMADALGLVWGVNDKNEPYASLGWSSPWPWGGDEETKNYRIISVSDKAAVILYYVWVSDPHVTVWREWLSYTVKDGEFKVTSQQIQFLEGICVAEEFYQAYPDGVIDGTMMDYYAYNGAGEALNQNSKNPNMASSAYTGLDAPDTAAISLLNLLKNENKVNTSVEYLNEKKTEAVVTFTFLENASTAKVRMIKPYGEDSIWLPQTY